MDTNVDYSYSIKLEDENSFVDWGIVDSPIGEQISKTSGFLISKNKTQETGYWQCTEGSWNCHVTNTEFCHFLEGECTYVSENGQVIEVKPGTVAVFPKDWKGTCSITKKIKKYYCIIFD
jgi:uncharacterized cupin superfamily protein|tara:strand:+ start:188 stop:547 length:360 start_codon:yes stop_codon:yes gene_type:complete